VQMDGISEEAEGEVNRISRNDAGLLEVDLRYESLGDEGAQALAKSLSANTHLKILLLTNNDIGDVGCEALGKAIARNNTLKTLDLAFNKAITNKGATYLLKGLEANTSITQLILLFNKQIGQDILKDIQKLLERNANFPIPASPPHSAKVIPASPPPSAKVIPASSAKVTRMGFPTSFGYTPAGLVLSRNDVQTGVWEEKGETTVGKQPWVMRCINRVDDECNDNEYFLAIGEVEFVKNDNRARYGSYLYKTVRHPKAGEFSLKYPYSKGAEEKKDLKNALRAVIAAAAAAEGMTPREFASEIPNFRDFLVDHELV